MKKIVYCDVNADRETENHKQAVEWYRQGHEIALRDKYTGEIYLVWEH